MQYRYALERPDYSNLASGRVFYSLPGHPAFPIRLASEIFQRCLAVRRADGISTPCVLYDPCCGTAYNLSVLTYLHWNEIDEVIGSDTDEKAMELAARNLDLLSPEGIRKRVREIAGMAEQFGKESHKQALDSAKILQERITTLAHEHTPRIAAFQASVFDGERISNGLAGRKADIVFTDVPYGRSSLWNESGGRSENKDFIWAMLEALKNALRTGGLVAIVSDKQQKAAHADYRRIEQFQVGKRRIAILRLAS